MVHTCIKHSGCDIRGRKFIFLFACDVAVDTLVGCRNLGTDIDGKISDYTMYENVIHYAYTFSFFIKVNKCNRCYPYKIYVSFIMGTVDLDNFF